MIGHCVGETKSFVTGKEHHTTLKLCHKLNVMFVRTSSFSLETVYLVCFSVFIDAQGGSVCNMVCPFRARLMTLLQAVITTSTAEDALLKKTAKRSSNHLMSELIIPRQKTIWLSFHDSHPNLNPNPPSLLSSLLSVFTGSLLRPRHSQ